MKLRYLVCAIFLSFVSGCALSNTSATGGGCANSLVSVSFDAFPRNQVQLSGTAGVAQSFVLQPTQTVSSVSLKLEGFSATNPSSLTGMMTVYIVQDASGGATPSSPNCTATAGGSTCAGSAIASGSLSLSGVSILMPQYYNIPLSSTVQNPTPRPAAFWIVATTSAASASVNHVSWDSTAYSGTQLLAQTTNTPGVGAPNWQTQNQTMTFQACK